MGRRLPVLLAALVAGVTIASLSFAGVPDPAFSTVPNVLVSPSGTLEYKVIVHNNLDQPLDSTQVELDFSAETDGLLCWCTGQTQSLITATTNALGEASFFIAAGGCIDPDSVVSPPVTVSANAVFLAEVGVVSTDFVDGAGKFPWDPAYNPSGSCAVGVGDAAAITPAIKSGVYEFCSDLNTDFIINVVDAVIVTPDIKTAATCTQAP